METNIRVDDRIKMYRKSDNTNNFIDWGDGIVKGINYIDGDPVFLRILTKEIFKLGLDIQQSVALNSPNFYCKKY